MDLVKKDGALKINNSASFFHSFYWVAVEPVHTRLRTHRRKQIY